MIIPVYQQKQKISPQRFTVPTGGNPEFTAIANAGKELQDIGLLIAEREKRRKQELDAVEVNKRFYGEGGLVDQTTQLSQGYFDLKESDAYGSSDRFNKDFGDLSRKWLDSFQDEQQRQKAEGLLLTYGNQKRTEIYKHESQQHQAAKKSAVSTALVGALKRVKNNPGETEEAVNLFKATVNDLHTGVDNTKLIYDAEEKIRKAAETSNLESQIMGVWNSALSLPQIDGEKLIKASGLPYTEKQKVLTDYRQEKKLENDRIEKENDARIEQNDDKVWTDYHEDRLSWGDLKRRRKKGEISQSTFLSIEKLIRSEEESEDNPQVVGDLSERIASGVNVKNDLLNALNQRQISGKTYASMRRALADKRTSKATAILNQALQPSQIDRWSPDKNLKHAQATTDLLNKIAAGQDPVDAALEVVDDYTSHLRRTRNGIPKPTYLEGNKDDPKALDDAEQTTVRSYQLNLLSPEEYKRQIEIIDNLRNLLDDTSKTETSTGQLNELKKQIVRD